MTKTDNKVVRQSNIELFRIVTMLLIVAHHYVVNSGIMAMVTENPFSVKSIFYLIFGAWGKTGINCFVLITGYFMCKSRITVRKYLKLLAEVEFYNIVIYLIFVITGNTVFSLGGFIYTIVPIRSVTDSFTSCFLLFYLFIPFLNVLIKKLDRRMHLILVALLLFVYTIMGTVPYISVSMNYVSWFVVLYLSASYLRFYQDSIKFFNNKLGLKLLSAIIVSICSIVFLAWYSSRTNSSMWYYFVADSNKVLAVFTSILSFCYFKNLNIKYSKVINTISASTFGVLLIHANSDAMRQWLWVDLLKNAEMFNSSYYYVHAIAGVLLVFIVCVLLDSLRIRIIENPIFKLWDSYDWRIKKLTTKYFETSEGN